MRAIKTEGCNKVLTAPADDLGVGDLPAQFGLIFDSAAGETQEDGRLGFVTTWRPTEIERAALAVGADVQLRVIGRGHPPVALDVTIDRDAAQAVIAAGHVGRALSLLYQDLRERQREARQEVENWPHEIRDDNADVLALIAKLDAIVPDDPAEFVALWERAIDRADEQHSELAALIREVPAQVLDQAIAEAREELGALPETPDRDEPGSPPAPFPSREEADAARDARREEGGSMDDPAAGPPEVDR
jgi:hypothetical protein